MTEYITQGISVTAQCFDCMQLDDVCDNCLELREARDSAIAHEIVDEGNLQYKRQWLLVTEPSGHDWTDREEEYKLPIVFLQDGGVLDNIWELEDYAQSMREVICQTCNLATPKQFNQCQCCDAVLEHNVR